MVNGDRMVMGMEIHGDIAEIDRDMTMMNGDIIHNENNLGLSNRYRNQTKVQIIKNLES